MFKKYIVITCLILSGSLWGTEFPVEGSMRIRVNFWKKVYTEIDHHQAFFHDQDDLTLIYKKLNLPQNPIRKHRKAKSEKRKLARLLRSIAKKNFKNLTKRENAIASLIKNKNATYVKKLAGNIRYQYGLRKRYFQGLVKSYAYIDRIKNIFKKKKIPLELAYLPHVESSFNYHAYSRVGAAGIWQFMRSTGRRYGLKVNYIIDERRDPILATKAAARFLRDNYKILKSWPLALTAYNHGPKSMLRAVSQLRTRDINKIIDQYNGRRFGFASKNFYATFMATVEISKEPDKYFRSFSPPSRFKYTSLKLPHSYQISQLTKAFGITKNTIKRYNPAIRRVAYKSSVNLPKNYILKLPVAKKKYASLLPKPQKRNRPSSSFHIVSRGETLYDIARIYKTSLNQLIAINSLNHPSRIHPGMKINISKKSLAKVSRKKLLASSRKSKKRSKKTPSISRKSKKNPSISLSKYNLNLKKVRPNIYKIQVETEETLGHYADWLRVKTQYIRNLNNMAHHAPLLLGQKLLLRIPKKKLTSFKKQRNGFHVSIQKNFYDSFKLAGTKTYVVKYGDTLSRILKKMDIPYWLVRKYQRKIRPNRTLLVAQRLIIPQFKSIRHTRSIPES